MVALIDYSKRRAAKETTNDTSNDQANTESLNINSTEDHHHHDDNHLVCQPQKCSHPHHKERSKSANEQIQAAQKAAASELPDKPKTPFSAINKKNRKASIHPASLPSLASARKNSLNPNSFLKSNAFKRCDTSELVREHRNRRPTILAEMSFADGMDSSFCDYAREKNSVQRPSVVMGKDWSQPSKRTTPSKKLVLSRPSTIGRSVSESDATNMGLGDLGCSIHSITETNDDEEGGAPKKRQSLGEMKESDCLSFTLRRPQGKSKDMDDSISSACRLEQSLSNVDHNSSFTTSALDMGLSASMQCHTSTGMYSQFRGRRQRSLSQESSNNNNQHARSYSPTRTDATSSSRSQMRRTSSMSPKRTSTTSNARSNMRRTSSMSPKRPQQVRRAVSMNHSLETTTDAQSSSPTTRRSKKRSSKSPRRSRSVSLQGHSSLQLLSMDPQTLRQAKQHQDDAIPRKITLGLESSFTSTANKSASFLELEQEQQQLSPNKKQQPLLPLDLDCDHEKPIPVTSTKRQTSHSLLSKEELGYGTLPPMVDREKANRMCSTQALPGYATDGDSIASEEDLEADDQSFAAEGEASIPPAVLERSQSHQVGSSSKTEGRRMPRRCSSFQTDRNKPSANDFRKKQLPRRCSSFQPPQQFPRNTSRSRSPVPSPAQIYGLGQHSQHNQHHLSPFHKQHSQQRRTKSMGLGNNSSSHQDSSSSLMGGNSSNHSLLMESSSSFCRTDSNASLASTGFVTGSRIRRIESKNTVPGKRPTRKQSVLG